MIISDEQRKMQWLWNRNWMRGTARSVDKLVLYFEHSLVRTFHPPLPLTGSLFETIRAAQNLVRMDRLQALEAPRWKSHLSVWGLLCVCVSASARVCYWRISPLIVCEGTRGEAEALAAGTPRIQETPSSTMFLGAEFRGLDGRRERRGGGRRRKEEWEGWAESKEGEENIKEKQTERRWGGGGDTAHAFHNRQKLLLIHSGLATTGKGQPPSHRVCILLNMVGNR